MKRIGLMGGSFDPVHIGHIKIVDEAIEQFDLDEFYFVPTGINPWKNKTIASNEQRIDMLTVAINSMNNKNKVGIELYEINHCNQKNYTYLTLEAICNNDNKYYYFMGSDQASQFNLWKKAKKISKLVQLVYFDRGGYSEDKDVISKYNFKKLKHKAIKASSSEIRDGKLELLDNKVLDYIGQNGLYLETMIKCRMNEKRYKHSLSVANLCKEIAICNRLDSHKAYIAGLMHDVAKEMDEKKARKLMKKYYPQYIDKPIAIWHQWLSAYVCFNEFHIKDQVILKAIEDHTTASVNISELGKALYVADKLDPLRGYDSSEDIKLCKEDVDEGFKKSLISFYEFSNKKGRRIDDVFFDIYNKFVIGSEDNG